MGKWGIKVMMCKMQWFIGSLIETAEIVNKAHEQMLEGVQKMCKNVMEAVRAKNYRLCIVCCEYAEHR